MNEPNLVGGRYELGELLGRGGMAEVRRGTDVRLGRTVAIKRLRTDLASDPTFQARFRREAQAAAALNHPAIVAVYDTGEEVSTEGGSTVAQPYIVMEYVAGRTLRDILREGRKILPERALEITSGVLSALDYSHRMGIIHRDIKPGNVMLTPSGDVKVMDFGIARAVSDAQSTMTQTAAVVGTAQYLSPEQARGENVDSRSDVYSAGCLLYELLTGRPPFVGESPVSVAYQHVREQAALPSSLDAELTPEIDAIVMKSLSKPVAERYASAADMKTDIDRYLAGHPVQAPAPVPVPTAVPESPTQVMGAAPADGAVTSTGKQPPVEPEEEDHRKRNRALLLLALLVALLIVLALIFGSSLFGNSAKQVRVPHVVGMTKAKAMKRLSSRGLTANPSYVKSNSVKPGHVVSEDPSAGSMVDSGSAVKLSIATGKPTFPMPDVQGADIHNAENTLRNRGLHYNPVEVRSDQTKGTVLDTNPPKGTPVVKGETVTIHYASGPQPIPNVAGAKYHRACAAIRQAGFQCARQPDPSSKQPAGTVTHTSPGPGTSYDQGQTVTLYTSTYKPKPKPSPTQTPSQTPSPTSSPSPSTSSGGGLLGLG